MPESYILADEEMKINYYRSLKDSILLRDIVHRYKIRDIELLVRLIALLTDSIGRPVSVFLLPFHRSTGQPIKPANQQNRPTDKTGQPANRQSLAIENQIEW